MRILMVHNRYQIRGGEDEVCDAEISLLQAHGHEVDLYKEHNDRLGKLNPIHSAANTIWSRHSYRKMRRQLSQKPYDIVHVHNFLPLISPSVYYAAKEQNVPVVQTLHNYRLLCPNALFFRQGSICEDCLGVSVALPGIYHGCYRNSHAATGVVAAMNSVHYWLKTWTSAVDVYIALTEFARQKYIQGGIPREKIKVKPNFVDRDPGVGEGKGNYGIYVGRLSVEKGIDTLLEAWQTIDNRLSLKIVGDGPLSEMVLQATEQNSSIEWLGRRPMEEVYELMGNAKVLIFPSKWYETFGRVAIEAFAKGTPVIAANIGAIAELVDSGRTGLLFEPGKSHLLAAQVKTILDNPTKVVKMRQEARKEYEKKYTTSRNYQQILGIYHQTIKNYNI
ncbi:glycosyltransferase family 4 protein [Pleurocapsa sp. PCC 7319]|uniref:glycosyltransferase family 4 protein n=1 Tax=Pleurocapsa sp. PCC 7319 TaxID=118161 RepID=UPI0003491485|nr:glycosyltransferase family 4 protein [Pleurocapsa sp. PCC 7319]